MKFKRLHKIVMILTCILLIAGCTSSSGQNKNEEKRTVKIMFWDESYFYQQYGDLFSMKFPNTDVEIVSTNNLSMLLALAFFVRYVNSWSPRPSLR